MLDRQAAFDAVYEIIKAEPATASDNARVWRCVHAALNALAGTLIAAESSRRDWAAEAEYRRREVEFEVNAIDLRWDALMAAVEDDREPREVCACISDDQAAALGPGFSRPVCAVHPKESA